LEQPKDNTRKKKPRWKKLLRWLVVDLLVLVILLLLLLYKPGRYHPIIVARTGSTEDRVHPYVSKELLPTFNNGVQSRRPFRMTILDNSLNEVIARYKWPQEASGISVNKPQVSFEPNRVVLMGTATVEGADLIVTVEMLPQFNEQGLFNFNVDKVKVGAMNITPLAKMIGKQKYEERIAAGGVPYDIRTQVAASVFTDEPFDPVVEYDGKKIRLKSIEVSQGQLDVEFIPAR
jgi:hypothetical protein